MILQRKIIKKNMLPGGTGKTGSETLFITGKTALFPLKLDKKGVYYLQQNFKGEYFL